MENTSSTQPSGPEKPAAARLSSSPQPTNGQHAQQNMQPLEIPKPEPFRISKPFAVSKFVLGSFNLVFAIIALGLTLGLLSTSYNMTSFIGVVICMALAIASLVWQIAEHATLLIRRDWHPIHPGAHVGVHLVLWVLAILVVLSLWVSLASEMRNYVLESDCEGDYWSSSSYNSGSSTDPYYCSFASFPTQAAADRYFGMFQALAAFATLIFICHFALFVMACVETDQRRRYDKATKVVYFLAAPGPVDGRMQYTPVTTQALGGNRGSVIPPPVMYQQQQQQQQGNADPGMHGYYAPPARVAPGTAA